MNFRFRRRLSWLAAAMAFLTIPVLAQDDPQSSPPNILILLADDLGYSDLGCYGGEIETPNLDRLAGNGLRYTQFYNTARCWPSRAAILSGYYPQQINRDPQGPRPPWAALLPRLLEPAGYRSYHSGKWHVDGPVLASGFGRSYVLNDHDRNFYPKNHALNDERLPAVEPGDDYYTTTAITDRAIEWLNLHEDHDPGHPFFLYLCYTVPHFPLHAPADDVAKYRGRFHEGWDVLRAKRLERLRSMGLLNCELSPRTPGVPAWESLTTDEQAAWEQRMEVHAAMVDRMDQEIGRVLDLLRVTGKLENTLILFLSDNGASAERILRGDGHDPTAPPGSARTYLCLEPGWANLANAPFRKSKIFTHEGGVATPLIIHWPARIAAKGELRRAPGHVIDFAPTFLDLAGLKAPETWDGQPRPPLPGRSLVPTFAADVPIDRDFLFFKHEGNRGLRLGDWKIVASGPESPWELYNLADDRSEMHDLAQSMPDKVRELATIWEHADAEYARQGRSEKPSPSK